MAQTSDVTAGDPEALSYGRRLSQLAAERGDEVAIVFAPTAGEEQLLSWRQLDERSNQVARLISEHTQDPPLVVVALPNSPENVLTTFAAWKVGASVLPLRYDIPAWERDRMLGLAGDAVVVGDWPDAPPGTVSSTDVRSTSGRPTSQLEDRVPTCARLIATSGSTGRPKIIVTPAPALYSAIPGAVQPLALRREGGGAVHLTASPLYHTNGYASCYMPLLGGDRVVLMERFSAELAVALIERHRVTHTILVPTMLQRIARLEDVRQRDFSSLERVLYGGATIPQWVMRTWLELVPPERFWISYGSSEGIGLCLTTGDVWLDHPGTTGRPADCEIKILGPDGAELPPGEVGDIYMRPTAEGPRFQYVGSDMPTPTEDGFWTIGDMGWVDDEGFLYIADRRQDMIVSGGANVFPAEVEAALTEHPAVVDVVVIGLPDPEWGRRVHAIVETGDLQAPTDEDLRAHCKARLASYKVPKSFEIIDRIPRSTAGKVNRGVLAAERTQDQVAPT